MPPFTPDDSTRPSAPLDPPRPALPPAAVPERLHEALLARVDQVRALAARPLVVGLAALVVVVAIAAGLLLQRRARPVSIDTALPRAATAATVGPGGSTASSDPTAPTPVAGDPAVPAGPAAAATAPLVVDVAGAVAHPGLFTFPDGGRVADALAAAGGPTPDADLERLNQAATLRDGQRIFVPRRGQADVPVAINGDGGGAVTAPGGGTPGSGTVPAGPVDLNTATLQELDALPGVGPSTAQAIIDQRQQNGPFHSVDDLLEVRGIGDAKLAALRARVRV